MKCLCVINKYWPSVGGSEMHTREIMQRLSQTNDVTVACFNSGGQPTNELAVAKNKSQNSLDGKVNTLHMAPGPLLKKGLTFCAKQYERNLIAKLFYTVLVILYSAIQLTSLIRKTDVVHLVYNGMTPIAEATLILTKCFGKRLVITPLLSFGKHVERAHPGSRLLRVIKHADSVVALTQLEKDYLVQLSVEQHKIDIIPVGALISSTANPNRFRSHIGQPDAPIVLFLSRLVAGKGYHLVAQAMEQVWATHSDAIFVFFGPRDKEAARVLNQFKDPRVVHVDDPDQQLKSDALSACSMLCVPTFHEGLGGVFVEAWHYKKPVIAGDIPVLNTVIDPGYDGLLISHTKNHVADAINQLLSEPKSAQKWVNKGSKK